MIDVLIPLSASSVEVPDRTPGQFWMSVVVVVLLIGAVIVAYRRNKFSKLPKAQREHKSAILGSIHNGTPETVRVPRNADPSEYRTALLEAFQRAYDRARGKDAAHDPDRVTIREASATVAREVHQATGERLPTVPRAARRVGGIAVLVSVLGALAVSTETIIRIIAEDRGQGAGIGVLFSEAVSLTVTVLSTLSNAVAMFPLGGFIAELVFAYGLLVATLVYHHWYILSVALIVGAITVAVLDRQVPDDLETRLYFHRKTLALETVGAAAVVWLGGVVPAWLGQLVGTITVAGRAFNIAAVGAAIGALFAFILILLIGYYAAKSLWKRLQHAATIDWPAGPDSIVGAYLVARYCAVGLALAATPLIPVYAIVALVDGRLVQVLAALYHADPVTQLLVIGSVAATIAVIAYVARGAADDVRAALVESFARQSIRVAILQRGLTVFGFIASYGVLWAFTRSHLYAPLGAAVIGLAVYAAYEGIDRAAYRLELFGRDESPTTDVLIQAYVARDADYEDASNPDEHLHPIAKVGSDQWTSRESIEETTDDALEMAAAAGERGTTVPATVGQQRAEDLLELGLVESDVESELQERIRAAIKDELRPNGRTTMSDLEDALEEFPAEIWEAEFERYVLLNVLSVSGDVIRLERDVWAADDHATPAQRFVQLSD